ncbi:MAG: hypothetical protein KDA86_23480 [Planctomycetaceae bacterium]|nr:hypothetical protein [Planctomycetaceae bacterium]
MKATEIHERFAKAVGILVEEPGGIKDRLMIAFISQLSEIPVPVDLPEPFAAEFDSISFEIDSDGRRGDEGTVSKELKNISTDEASRIARRIYGLFLAMNNLQEFAVCT